MLEEDLDCELSEDAYVPENEDSDSSDGVGPSTPGPSRQPASQPAKQAAPSKKCYTCETCGTQVAYLARHLRKVHKVPVSEAAKWRYSKTKGTKRFCPFPGCKTFVVDLPQHLGKSHGLKAGLAQREEMLAASGSVRVRNKLRAARQTADAPSPSTSSTRAYSMTEGLKHREVFVAYIKKLERRETRPSYMEQAVHFLKMFLEEVGQGNLLRALTTVKGVSPADRLQQKMLEQMQEAGRRNSSTASNSCNKIRTITDFLMNVRDSPDSMVRLWKAGAEQRVEREDLGDMVERLKDVKSDMEGYRHQRHVQKKPRNY